MSAVNDANQSLPKSATITIRDGRPYPDTEVEVAPGGRIIFANADGHEYRLRFSATNVGEDSRPIDFLLPPNGSFTVLINVGDEFTYQLFDLPGKRFMTGPIPIRN